MAVHYRAHRLYVNAWFGDDRWDLMKCTQNAQLALRADNSLRSLESLALCVPTTEMACTRRWMDGCDLRCRRAVARVERFSRVRIGMRTWRGQGDQTARGSVSPVSCDHKWRHRDAAFSGICNKYPAGLFSLRCLPNTTALPQRNATSIRMEHCSFPFFLRCIVIRMIFVDQNYAKEGDLKQSD